MAKNYQIFNSVTEIVVTRQFEHTGFVYVFASDNKLTKIGITKSPSRRITHICTASGFSMLRCAISLEHVNYKKNEEQLFSLFSEKRTYGEWFSITFDEGVSALSELTMLSGRKHKQEQHKIQLHTPSKGSVYRQLGSPFWYVSITLPDKKRIQTSTKTEDYEDACKIAERLKKEAFDQFVAGAKKNVTVMQIIKDYLDTKVDIASHKSYVHHSKWLFRIIGNSSIYSLDDALLSYYVTERKESGATGATINRELAVLSAALNHERRAGVPVANLVGKFRQVENSSLTLA